MILPWMNQNVSIKLPLGSFDLDTAGLVDNGR